MEEVGTRAVRLFAESILACGVPLERVVEGTSIGAGDLLAGVRVRWGDYVAMHDNLERALRGRMTLEQYGQTALRVPSYAFLRAIAARVASPQALFRVAERWLAPGLFPHMRFRLRELPDGVLEVEGVVPDAERDSSSFFRVMAGLAAAMPTLCDLPPAVVDAEISRHRVHLRVTLPEDHGLLSRLRRFARATFGARKTLEDLAAQRAELDAGLQALARTRRDFRHVLEHLPAAVGIHKDGVFLWANHAFCDLFGIPRARIAGAELMSVIHPDEREQVRARLAQPPEQTPAAREYRLIRADGRVIVCEIAQTQAIEFDGTLARIVVGVDVTERKQLTEQLLVSDRLASVGMVAAGVAHEINNPLTWVSVQLDVASRAVETGDTGTVREALAVVRDGVERVRRIVTDLKTFSRVDEEASAVDVHETIDAAIALALPEIRQRAMLVRELSAVPRVRASRARLGQVLLNLLLNAVEALPDDAPGRHSIAVRTSTIGDRVAIEIEDDGVGIPPGLERRVFEPFFTTKPVGKGTGLGLSICHTLVERMGGEIAVVPARPPMRTAFRVLLPVGDAAEAARSSQPPAVTERRARVLVIDDEPQLVSVLRLVLAEEHDVVSAGSGAEALRLLEGDRRFDVILCDLMMPGTDGIALHDALRSIDPALCERMVFMTGGAFTARARAFLAEAPNLCLDKPIDTPSLLSAVRARVRRVA